MSTTTDRPGTQIYIPYSHPVNSTISQRTTTIVAGAGHGGDGSIQAAFKDLAKTMPPGMPLFDIQEGDLLVDDATWQIRTRTEVLLILAVITFVITGFGVYSSISYSVGLRAQELAIRRALGGGTSHLLLLVMRDGMILTGAAVVVGAILYFLLWKTLGAAVTEMPQLTPLTIGATGGILILLTLLYTFPPALKAARATDFSVLRS
jgi:predicted lysophospholipase L1 biosynthesis ABC-type transport system permease subunit